ncbi:unnamed protein product [Rhizophagus irregularis]|nr:unnamed protein product [Rhizophagus irregularis]
MLSVRKRVIELAEQQNDLSGEYWTLNDDFTKRLEDVNRYQDEKESGEKRPILESPSAPARKPILVDVNEDSDDGSEEKEDKDENCEANTELEKEESSTKAPETLSKTQLKKKKKRENRRKK